MLRLALLRAVVISIYDIQRAVADKATEWEMSNDEFGMTNWLDSTPDSTPHPGPLPVRGGEGDEANGE